MARAGGARVSRSGMAWVVLRALLAVVLCARAHAGSKPKAASPAAAGPGPAGTASAGADSAADKASADLQKIAMELADKANQAYAAGDMDKAAVHFAKLDEWVPLQPTLRSSLHPVLLPRTRRPSPAWARRTAAHPHQPSQIPRTCARASHTPGHSPPALLARTLCPTGTSGWCTRWGS